MKHVIDVIEKNCSGLVRNSFKNKVIQEKRNLKSIGLNTGLSFLGVIICTMISANTKLYDDKSKKDEQNNKLNYENKQKSIKN